MFIGHLPAGYLMLRKWAIGSVLAAGLIGSVAPDIDILWFYFVDNRSTHHHEYITHRPVVWIVITLLGLALRKRYLGQLMFAFGIGGVLHMMLDTIAGSIAWGWPLYHQTQTLVVVPATHSNWIISFLTHWTFGVEIAVTVLSAVVFWRDVKRGSPQSD